MLIKYVRAVFLLRIWLRNCGRLLFKSTEICVEFNNRIMYIIIVKSNREEGLGRPDIALYPYRPKDPAIIFEVKVCKNFNQMEAGLQKAYDRIRDQKYEEGILADGYIGSKAYGICFCKKSCIVGKME